MSDVKCGVEVIDFCCVDGFVEDVVGKIVSNLDDYYSASVISDGCVTQELIKTFLAMVVEIEDFGIADFDLGAIRFDPEDYGKEYVLTIANDFEIWCEPMWRDNEYGVGYIDVEDDFVYIHGDCNYKVLEHIDSEDTIIFGIDNE